MYPEALTSYLAKIAAAKPQFATEHHHRTNHSFPFVFPCSNHLVWQYTGVLCVPRPLQTGAMSLESTVVWYVTDRDVTCYFSSVNWTEASAVGTRGAVTLQSEKRRASWQSGYSAVCMVCLPSLATKVPLDSLCVICLCLPVQIIVSMTASGCAMAISTLAAPRRNAMRFRWCAARRLRPTQKVLLA